MLPCKPRHLGERASHFLLCQGQNPKEYVTRLFFVLDKKTSSRLRIGIDATDIDMDMFKGGIYHYIINLITYLREIDKDMLNRLEPGNPTKDDVKLRLGNPNEYVARSEGNRIP